MTERSKEDAEAHAKLSKALCDQVDRSNEVARKEMSALITTEVGVLVTDFGLKASAEEDPSGVAPQSPPSPTMEEEAAVPEMEAPAPMADEDSVPERNEILAPQLQANLVVPAHMLYPPTPPTPYFQHLSPSTLAYD